jgi:hypothetical protein
VSAHWKSPLPGADASSEANANHAGKGLEVRKNSIFSMKIGGPSHDARQMVRA